MPVLRPIAGVVVLFCALAFFQPLFFTLLLGKERSVEHVSHLLLVGVMALWCASYFSGKGRPLGRQGIVLVALAALLFLEETDYGRVYGFTWAADLLYERFGVFNFHNRMKAGAGVFDPYAIFRAVILLYFFLAFFAKRLSVRWWGPYCPAGNEVLAIFVIAILDEGKIPFFEERGYYFQELWEALFYFILFAIAVRGFRTAIASFSESPVARPVR